MNIIKQYYPIVDETLLTVKLDNGLMLYLINKKDFKVYYASLGVLYGSNNNTFIPYGEKDYVTMPIGLAHFLEHQLFEKEDNDASLIFSQYGIESNAYTSFLETNYYITGTDNLELGINLLLDFIQNGYFSNEHVEREKGVISSEIKMYLDNPSSRIYDGICNNLFEVDNLKNDIAGSIDSINQITPEMLEKAYKTFYQPHNMHFCLVGSFDEKKIIDLICENQNKKSFLEKYEIKSLYPIEKKAVKSRYSEITMDIIYPKVAIGLKLPGFKENSQLIQKMFRMILDSLLGYSSKIYQEMLDKELFNGGFTYTATITPYSSFLKIQADTVKVEEFIAFIKKVLLGVNDKTITQEKIERNKKNFHGLALKAMNNIEWIATSFMDFKFVGENFFDYIEKINHIKYEDFLQLLKYFNEDNISVFVINKSKA